VAGVGAVTSALFILHTGNYFGGFFLAGLVAAAVSAVIGLPALRIKGLMLAVTTLSFALAAQTWLFGQSWLLGQGIHFVTTSAGDPTRYTRMLKDAGVTVYHATATLRGAIKAVAGVVDVQVI